jgi:hypothetical protein
VLQHADDAIMDIVQSADLEPADVIAIDGVHPIAEQPGNDIPARAAEAVLVLYQHGRTVAIDNPLCHHMLLGLLPPE